MTFTLPTLEENRQQVGSDIEAHLPIKSAKTRRSTAGVLAYAQAGAVQGLRERILPLADIHQVAQDWLRFVMDSPAGAKRSSLMRVGSSLPIHFTEYGGLETMASKGFSSPKWGSLRVSPSWMLNLS